MSKQWFEIEVWLPGRGPLRTIVPGDNWEQAKVYAALKYPQMLVSLVETASKPELVRSRNGPKKTAQEKHRIVQQESRS